MNYDPQIKPRYRSRGIICLLLIICYINNIPNQKAMAENNKPELQMK